MDEAPKDATGEPIFGGIFAVLFKEISDRLISDRRPLNEVEGGWVGCDSHTAS